MGRCSAEILPQETWQRNPSPTVDSAPHPHRGETTVRSQQPGERGRTHHELRGCHGGPDASLLLEGGLKEKRGLVNEPQ